MKNFRTRIFATLAGVLLTLSPAFSQQAAAGRASAPPRPVSPEIHSDHTVRSATASASTTS
jgi:hypothetical protein